MVCSSGCMCLSSQLTVLVCALYQPAGCAKQVQVFCWHFCMVICHAMPCHMLCQTEYSSGQDTSWKQGTPPHLTGLPQLLRTAWQSRGRCGCRSTCRCCRPCRGRTR
jgi:hypothetical protein